MDRLHNFIDNAWYASSAFGAGDSSSYGGSPIHVKF
jgi:hypothetical protein